MSFYRKYRPQTIQDLDNPDVQEKLLGLLTKEKKELPHAFLFSGPRGAGKTTTARLIAKLLNCEKPSRQGEPCGVCSQCQSIATGNNLDVLELDAASNRGIDEIRALRDSIHLSPSHSLYKVYIIDEVHMLTTEAFNALLKTLEEPPVHAVFVLATTDPQKVPITIKSRCVQITFGRATDAGLRSALKKIIKEEKLTVDDEGIAAIIHMADGSFRDGVKLLEQVSFHKGTITRNVVVAELSGSDERSVSDFTHALSSGSTLTAFTIVESLVLSGKDIKTFLTDVLRTLEKFLIDVAKGKPIDGWTREKLLSSIHALTIAYSELRLTPIAALPLEIAILTICAGDQSSMLQMTEKKTVAVPTPNPVLQKTESITDKRRAEVLPNDAVPVVVEPVGDGLITLEQLVEHWKDIIDALKGDNHSVAGVLRSTRPKSAGGGIVVIEAFYPFHKERLSEVKARESISAILKKLFGEKVKVEIVLGKK